jgi:hypothetical protein
LLFSFFTRDDHGAAAIGAFSSSPGAIERRRFLRCDRTRYVQIMNTPGREGDVCRGRVANLACGEFLPQYDRVPYISQHSYDSTLSFLSGNEHRDYGLQYHDIPTLSVDNQFSSPSSMSSPRVNTRR